MLNVSTGMFPKGGKQKIGGQILSLAIDSSGQIIWTGNDKVISLITKIYNNKIYIF